MEGRIRFTGDLSIVQERLLYNGFEITLFNVIRDLKSPWELNWLRRKPNQKQNLTEQRRVVVNMFLKCRETLIQGTCTLS